MRFAPAIALDDALEERRASAAHAGRKAARAADPRAKPPKDFAGKRTGTEAEVIASEVWRWKLTPCSIK